VKELIKKMTEAWGPSGYEHHVRKLIQEEVTDLADEVFVDPLGNLICRVGKGGTKIMVAAHMDEIGVMTNFVEPSGYLRFANLGGLRPNTLNGHRVIFEDGTMGVISTNANGNSLKIDDFFIDVDDGLEGDAPQAGRPASLWREMEIRGDRIISKALDDRIGCVVAIEAMRKLKGNTPNELYFVFTVQEEVGLRGATTAAYSVDPDVGIALDVTGTGDTIKGIKMGVKLGGGAAIKVKDNSLVTPPAVIDWMKARAEADNIPYQMELLPFGGTDAGAIQIARAGVPSGCISIPCRFIHTVSETADVKDIQASIDLLYGLVSNPVEL
jgi:tetrahedral aminopeptidase